MNDVQMCKFLTININSMTDNQVQIIVRGAEVISCVILIGYVITLIFRVIAKIVNVKE